MNFNIKKLALIQNYYKREYMEHIMTTNKVFELWVKIIYLFFGLSLYYVAVEFVQPLKLITILLLIIFLMCYNLIYNNGLIYVKKIYKWWFFTIFIFLISLLYTINFVNSLKFILLFIGGILILVLIGNSSLAISEFTVKTHYYISVSILMFTIFSYFFPNLFEAFINPLLMEGSQGAFRYFLNNGTLSGISGQTGTNAFLLSVGLSILLFKKKNFKDIVLLLLFVFFIFMSGKRGIILANLIAYITVYFVINRFNYKKIISIIVILICLALSTWWLLSFNLIRELNEFSSGRIALYNQAINIFKENFLFGTGINTFSTNLIESIYFEEGLNAHNVYIQLLSEVGLIGLIIFCIAQISTFTYVYKLSTEKTESKYILSVLYFNVFFIIYSLLGNPLYDYSFFYIYLSLIAPLITNQGKNLLLEMNKNENRYSIISKCS